MRINVCCPNRLAWFAVLLFLTGTVLQDFAGQGFAEDSITGVAEQPTGNEPSPVDLDSPVGTSKSESMLLLTTGRIVTGHVTRNGNQYLVKMATGEMFVPAEHVAISARDLRDCYRQLQDKLPGEAPADEHLSLARWCLSRQMLNEARNEALETLRIAPSRDDARQLIQKIDSILDPPVSKKPSAEEVERAKLRTAYGVNDFESLGGLTREQARLFTSRVHPILLNNCTSSGCHGSSMPSTFKLERLPLGDGPRKQIVLRNLTAVLAQIDRQSPDDSPLLAAKTGPHSRSGRVVFAGAKGAEQARLVRDWIRMVSDNTSDRSTPTDKNPGLAHHGSDESASERKTETTRRTGTPKPTVRGLNASTRRRPDAGRSPGADGVDVMELEADFAADKVQSARDLELISPPEDKFSPDEFNARSEPSE